MKEQRAFYSERGAHEAPQHTLSPYSPLFYTAYRLIVSTSRPRSSQLRLTLCACCSMTKCAFGLHVMTLDNKDVIYHLSRLVLHVCFSSWRGIDRRGGDFSSRGINRRLCIDLLVVKAY